MPVLAAGGIGTGRQMAAALALGADGVWTGSIWLTVAESSTEPHVVENLLVAGVARHRALAVDDRQAGPPAAHGVDRGVGAPGRAGRRCRCRCRACCSATPPRRFGRVRDPRFGGSPVGQIVGQMNAVRPAKDVVFDMVEEWIETVERMHDDIAPAGD